MKAESYTPGYSQNAVDFMSKRSFDSHGEFFSAHLTAGVTVLDCGCGPGSITLGIATRIYPGRVIGVDLSASQIAQASDIAASHSIGNVAFQTADCYFLPLAGDSFDQIFSHALFEHLSDPALAFRELQRVLKPGGIIGVCSPDWGGFDVEAGRKLAVHLAATGFEIMHISARYECYPSLQPIAEYLGFNLNEPAMSDRHKPFALGAGTTACSPKPGCPSSAGRVNEREHIAKSRHARASGTPAGSIAQYEPASVVGIPRRATGPKMVLDTFHDDLSRNRGASISF